MSIIHLADRKLVRMTGTDTETLLQRLITTNLDAIAEGEAGYGALLTPQGKILFDFLVTRTVDGFLFDLAAGVVDDFIKKMTLYRLRSDIAIEALADQVGYSFDPQPGAIRDPRSEKLGWRLYGSGQGWETGTDAKAVDARFIQAAIPQGGKDFAFADVFPHDVNMDYLGGIDFTKGCYVGQEVVSRMQHRGSARKRLVRVSSDQALPDCGTEITVAGKTVGTLGQVQGKSGLALVRIDRVGEAVTEQQSIHAGDAVLQVFVPEYASFSLSR